MFAEWIMAIPVHNSIQDFAAWNNNQLHSTKSTDAIVKPTGAESSSKLAVIWLRQHITTTLMGPQTQSCTHPQATGQTPSFNKTPFTKTSQTILAYFMSTEITIQHLRTIP